MALRRFAFLCDTSRMGESRQGRVKIEAGLWSKTIAADFAHRIETSEGYTKDRISKETGIAGSRVTQLLRGDRAWYVEDIEKFCKVFGLQIPMYLESIQARIEAHLRPFKVALPAHNGAEGSDLPDEKLQDLIEWYESITPENIKKLEA